jgi:hypothetical protein
MMPTMVEIQRSSYSFWLAFRRALIDERDSLVGCDDKSLDIESLSPEAMDITSDNSRALLDDLIKDCLRFAALQWSYVQPWMGAFGRRLRFGSSRSSSVENRDEPNATKIDRVVEVLEELIVSGDISFCDILFEDILKASQSGSVGETIINLYAHLLPPLCKLLSKLNKDISAPPFVDFLQKIIAMYLKNVLGDKDELHNCLLRSLACGEDKCDDCKLLDLFILDPTTTSKIFRLGYYNRRRRDHLDSRVSTAKDICSSERGTREDEYFLRVTKKPVLIEASQWETRLQNATNFLALIGPDDIIAQIMGSTYQDVTKALSGEKPFGSTSAKRTGARTTGTRKKRKT